MYAVWDYRRALIRTRTRIYFVTKNGLVMGNGQRNRPEVSLCSPTPGSSPDGRAAATQTRRGGGLRPGVGLWARGSYGNYKLELALYAQELNGGPKASYIKTTLST